MSVPLINRSLTTIRTELEFLYDSEVITNELYEKFLSALPQKYSKDMQPSGVEKLNENSSDKLANSLESTHISAPPPSGPPPSSTNASKPVGYCTAVYDYSAQEGDDIHLKKDDKIAVVEHLSQDWWKGYKKGQDASSAGVFPSNYVKVISEQEFNNTVRAQADKPHENEKARYSPQPPQYDQQQQQQQWNNQQPPYQSQGSYSQFPPPSTNYYQQPQQVQQAPPQEQQPQQQQGNSHPHLKKFGSKLGNAAIFGAGATIGSDIVNSIF
ncbi:[PSI+] inducibility protein 3 [[Candida] railenensis]|uniref:[PSI+] inducibility protein 3 n=1 Tax=[Candida] railenensis TaxID=45579 RepID=A0A9P0QLP8_9ASCO|nr:[PSI+] inducibility protein 3 [[Candida] railenensis]